jgi:F0F1-type ATP synthase membrane subunit c/vacuolar-type H+-ATPase subunit K
MLTTRVAEPPKTQERTATVAAIAVAVLGCAIVAGQSRHLTFSGDDWAWVQGRKGHSADVFLTPHGEHLSALPILAFKVLLAVFGAGSYVPFMALLLVVHGTACVLLYLVARRFVGPWAALAPTAILAVLGPAWQDLLWAFQVGYLGSVAAGLGMLLCLERRTALGDVAAAMLLGVSLLCSSIGLGMVVFAAVSLALEQPRSARRAWVVVVPAALYAAWYAEYGVSSAHASNLEHLPGYLARALAAALASAAGLAQTDTSPYLVATRYGYLLAVVGAGVVVVRVLRGGRLPALAWGALATAGALWTAQCLSFMAAREANQSRYQYVAVTLVLLAASALASDLRLTARRGAVLGAVVLLVCASNVAMLHERSGLWNDNGMYTSAELGALEVSRDVVHPTFAPENGFVTAIIGVHNMQPVIAGPYFKAIDTFGSPADDPAGILRRPEPVREAADLVLAFAERTYPAPSSAPESRSATCRSAGTGAGLREVAVGPGTLTLHLAPGPPAVMQLRRFAAEYRDVRSAPLRGGTTASLTLPRDRSALRWRLRVVGGRGLRLCTSRTP